MPLNIPLKVLLSWPAPNYDNPETKSESIILVSAISISILSATVLCRLYTRIYIKNLVSRLRPTTSPIFDTHISGTSGLMIGWSFLHLYGYCIKSLDTGVLLNSIQTNVSLDYRHSILYLRASGYDKWLVYVCLPTYKPFADYICRPSYLGHPSQPNFWSAQTPAGRYSFWTNDYSIYQSVGSSAIPSPVSNALVPKNGLCPTRRNWGMARRHVCYEFLNVRSIACILGHQLQRQPDMFQPSVVPCCIFWY